jgi:hypothetical protein
MLLGIPFIVGGALFAIGIATSEMWLLAPASVCGPGAMILGFTYLEAHLGHEPVPVVLGESRVGEDLRHLRLRP